MSYPDYELNEPTTEKNILKMLELIYNEICSKNKTNKLFYIKIQFNKYHQFLNYDKDHYQYFLSDKYEASHIQTKFTQKEINKMKEDPIFSCLNLEQCIVPVEEEE